MQSRLYAAYLALPIVLGGCFGTPVTRTETVVQKRWFACPTQPPVIRCPDWPAGQETPRQMLLNEPKQRDAFTCWREGVELEWQGAYDRCLAKIKEAK